MESVFREIRFNLLPHPVPIVVGVGYLPVQTVQPDDAYQTKYKQKDKKNTSSNFCVQCKRSLIICLVQIIEISNLLGWIDKSIQLFTSNFNNYLIGLQNFRLTVSCVMINLIELSKYQLDFHNGPI